MTHGRPHLLRKLVPALLGAAILLPALALAQELHAVKGDGPVRVEDVTAGAQYEGTLDGRAQDFEFRLSARTVVGIALAVPEGSADRDVSATIVRDGNEDEPVATLDGSAAGWDTTFTEPATGVTYRNGMAITIALERGDYVVHVWSPDNRGPYALRFDERVITKAGFEAERSAPRAWVVILFVLVILAGALLLRARDAYQRKRR